MATWRECREARDSIKENIAEGITYDDEIYVLLEYVEKLETANKQLLEDVREWLE